MCPIIYHLSPHIPDAVVEYFLQEMEREKMFDVSDLHNVVWYYRVQNV